MGFMRQSWKPSVEIACSMVLRENLCGGVSRELSVPVSPRAHVWPGACCRIRLREGVEVVLGLGGEHEKTHGKTFVEHCGGPFLLR